MRYGTVASFSAIVVSLHSLILIGWAKSDRGDLEELSQVLTGQSQVLAVGYPVLTGQPLVPTGQTLILSQILWESLLNGWPGSLAGQILGLAEQA